MDSKTEQDTLQQLEQIEARLRQAMLTSNVAELDALIDDRLLFIGPDGNVYHKADDLELHRSGAEKITHLEFEQVLIEQHGQTAVVIVLAMMAGELQGQPFAGRYRYSRTWVQRERGWQIVAGSVCAVPT